MTHRQLTSAVPLAALAVALSVSSPRAAAKRSITETDLFKFTWVADPEISPGGDTVAFVRVVVNEKENRYETAIYSVPSTGAQPPRPLTAGIRDLSPRWSPDGRWIVFTRSVDKDGQTQPPQLYLLRTDGGEARALTDLPKGAGNPVWSPDGKQIAFSSTTVAGRLQEARSGREARTQNRREGGLTRGLSRQRQSDLRRRRPSRAHLGRRR